MTKKEALDFIGTVKALEKYGITMTVEDVEDWCLGGEDVVVDAESLARQIAEYAGKI